MAAVDSALGALAPGPLLRIGSGSLAVDVAPQAGGRIAQITHDGVEWLQGHDAAHAQMIAWGCFPMLPWAGRLRHGAFRFEGHDYRLAPNLGQHAIHGFGFALPWQVESGSTREVALSLALPADARWPFGGLARQRIRTATRRLELDLSITAGAQAMPATLGWHPWLHRPDRLDFRPERVYPRDAEGIATRPLGNPPNPPWDDCFVNRQPVRLERAGQTLQLESDCTHWVVFDEPAHAICIEPQSGPPDAFNLEPPRLEGGATLAARFLWEWR